MPAIIVRFFVVFALTDFKIDFYLVSFLPFSDIRLKHFFALTSLQQQHGTGKSSSSKGSDTEMDRDTKVSVSERVRLLQPTECN